MHRANRSVRPERRPRAFAARGRAIVLLVATVTVWSCRGPDPRVHRLVEDIDEERLLDRVRALTRNGPRSIHRLDALRAAADWIEDDLRRSGYVPVREGTGVRLSDGQGGSWEAVNIIAERRGAQEPGRVLELGAHYDTVPRSPGADDNASGVAGVLEAARIAGSVRLQRTLRFVFFCLEEYGKSGSARHVALLRRREEPIEGLLNLEMVGFVDRRAGSQGAPFRVPLLEWPPRTGDFITVIGSFGSAGLGRRFESAARRYTPELRYFSLNVVGSWFEDSWRSDHEAYWEASIPAVMLTDTAEFRNPHYHEPGDLPGTLDPGFLRQVTVAATAAALEWAGVTGAAPDDPEAGPGRGP